MFADDDGTINGWRVVLHPDFVKFYDTGRYLDRLNTGGQKKAKKLIEAKVKAICKSTKPGSSTYPKLGNMKWLRGKKGVKIQEDRLTGDFRILFLPTNPARHELTFYAIKDHDGVQEFLRDAHARVHNAAIDEFNIQVWEQSDDYSIDMTQADAEQKVQQIQADLERLVGAEKVKQNEQKFIEVSRTCSIYRLGKYGIELDPSPEQLNHISSPSPMLLPGVAGTGKSTVLQYRFRDSILSYNDSQDDFFKRGIYLTLNKPLANSTRSAVNKILPKHYSEGINSAIQDINSWVSVLLGEETSISTPNLTFDYFRKWWSRRQTIQRYDPAQAWEEYRGVIKGTARSLDYEDGAISLDDYLSMPHDRCAYPIHEREQFYVDIVEAFEHSRKQSDSVLYDDQDLIRRVKQMNLPRLYRHIFIDEVQDLTELQLLVIMELLETSITCLCTTTTSSCTCPPSCGNCHCLIFDVTGDLSQQVYPTRFTWQSTKRAIFETLEIRCHERQPMATSYRSVRSIVDLSSYYLEQMVSEYRQGGDIAQAQAEQKAETPALLEGSANQLYQIVSTAGLPASYCPIIVRDEAEKIELQKELQTRTRSHLEESLRLEYSGSMEVQTEELEKRMAMETTRIESYTLTIADAKGLEWNNVVLWDISSGSDRLLERKLHEKRGNYIEETDWNYQLELRHVFVATTRARLLLLHIGKIKENQEVNPFYSDLLQNELILVEESPADLTRFSIAELTTEEYEDMAKSYENKEMFGAAAYIYENNLKNHKKATEMKFLEAKRRNDRLLMAKLSIAYERTYEDSTLGPEELQHVLGSLSENGDDTELGYIIEIAKILGLENKAKLAELRRKVNIAKVFGNDEIYQSIARDYEELQEWIRAGDFYAKADERGRAIKVWWKGHAYEKAWEFVIPSLAPSTSSNLEFLLIDLVTQQRITKEMRKLFSEQFEIDLDNSGWNILKNMNIKLSEIEFGTSEAKKRVAELAYSSLTPEEKMERYFQNMNWQHGLNYCLEEQNLELKHGLERCMEVAPEKLFDWFVNQTEAENPGLTTSSKLDFFQYLYARRFQNTPSLLEMKQFLLELNIPQAKQQLIAAGSNLQKWYHALHCVHNPKNANTKIGKANISVLVRWYTEPQTVENDFLLHSIRNALHASLEATYTAFEESTRRTIQGKEQIREALIIAELFIKVLMNPQRFSTGNYPRIRKAIIGWIKHTDMEDFVDPWFDFFLDMKPSGELLRTQGQLKRDIQVIFPLFKERVNGYTEGLPSVELYPDNSLTRSYDDESKKYSFSRDGLMILKRNAYSKGQMNAVMRIIDEMQADNPNLAKIYVAQLILYPAKNIEPQCFFETVEEFLSTNENLQKNLSGIDNINETMQTELDHSHQLNPKSEEPVPQTGQTETESGLTDTIYPLEEPLGEDHDLFENTDADLHEEIPKPAQRVMSDEATETEETLSPQTIINELHQANPENVASWFAEYQKHRFGPQNAPFILECYTTFIRRLEQKPESFTVENVNEWLCFHEILKIMWKEPFNFPENPYRTNQSMAEQLGNARREVATNRSEYSQEKVNALIRIQ